ncbi:hypothetical protein FRC00_010731 [Tulasnella sp. 408]|nr:hypothetical protein FRC00_010731 [Tulasnella sp. 408]
MQVKFVINTGIKMEMEDEDKEQDGSLLYSIEDRLETTLVNQEGTPYISKDCVEHLLWEGMKAARQVDVHLIKTEIHKYRDFQPVITNMLKSSSGYSHLATRMLLCPAHLNWSDESVQERFQHGEELPNVDTLFYFMYENYPPSPNSLNRGLLCSTMLIKAYKAVFLGPSSATVGPTSGGTQSTKLGNTILGGITGVTPSTIAYITCIVQFALSSEPQFTPGSVHQGFDNCGFFRALIQMLEGPNPSGVRKPELLEWWNTYVRFLFIPTAQEAAKEAEEESG